MEEQVKRPRKRKKQEPASLGSALVSAGLTFFKSTKKAASEAFDEFDKTTGAKKKLKNFLLETASKLGE